jgi:DNA-binding NarL/FixJ family response regulator
VVVAGDDQTRVLFRGLLRLHHFQVVGETGGSTEGDELVRRFQPAVLVADVSLSEGSLASLVPAARARSPGTRIIIVQPTGRPSTFVDAQAPDAMLTRPFRVKDFVDAISAVQAAGSSPVRPGPSV